jgi:hypothetical protein
MHFHLIRKQKSSASEMFMCRRRFSWRCGETAKICICGGDGGRCHGTAAVLCCRPRKNLPLQIFSASAVLSASVSAKQSAADAAASKEAKTKSTEKAAQKSEKTVSEVDSQKKKVSRLY